MNAIDGFGILLVGLSTLPIAAGIAMFLFRRPLISLMGGVK